MKRKLLCGVAIISATLASISTEAAAAPQNIQNDPCLFCNWTGFYLGISGGGAWEHVKNSLSIVNDPVNPYFFPPAIPGVNASGSSSFDKNKAYIGGQLGYNQQNGNFVWGIEFSFNDINIKENHGGQFLYTSNNAPYNLTTSASTNWLFTLDPRIGWAYNRALFYVTGGLSEAQLKFKQFFSEPPFTPTPETASYSKIKTGWNLGLGIEYAINNCWTVRAQYLYNRFNSQTVRGSLVNAGDGISGATFNNSLDSRNIQMLSVGVNYLFS